jgi:hypothetical protein
MTIKKWPGVLILIVVLTGCVGTYGQIKGQNPQEKKTTIQDLARDRDNYLVYYGSRDGVRPSGLIFDPRENETRLTGDSWTLIEDQKAFDSILQNVKGFEPNAVVAQILGPDNRFFGFIYYSPRLHVPVKVADENTLYVMSLPKPISTP